VFPIAFVVLFFLAIELLSSGLDWAGEGGGGVTPAAMVVSATLTLTITLFTKNIVLNRVLR
jgi:hypothetical protein